MSAIAPDTPSSPQSLYRHLRVVDRLDHDEARRKVAHAYGRSEREVQNMVRVIRHEIETPAEEVEEPEVIAPAEDPLDTKEGQLLERIEKLEADRRDCAVDCLHSGSRAAELSKIEQALAAERLALERHQLGRAELPKVEAAEAQRIDAEAKAAARALADQIGNDRQAVEVKLRQRADALAQETRKLESLAHRHVQALAAAGVPGAERAGGIDIRPVLANALANAGADHRWIG